GETGSNGAVGASLFGKLVIIATALGWFGFAILAVTEAIGLSTSSVLKAIAGILVVGGGVLATFAIHQRGVARGAARWVLAVPVVISIVWVILRFGWIGGDFTYFDS